jgi:hypothetical protein
MKNENMSYLVKYLNEEKYERIERRHRQHQAEISNKQAAT